MERLLKMTSTVIYKDLREQRPDFLDCVHIIDGDIAQLSLGISAHDQMELFKNAEIVIHAAADVGFDTMLRDMTLVNVRGTREILRLCKKMERLISLQYISTAYSQCNRLDIEEKFYKPPICPDELIKLAEFCNNDNVMDDVNVLTSKLIGSWPNTYSFSKAVAEELLRRECNNLPISVLRPSISK